MDILGTIGFLNNMSQDDKIDSLEQLVKDLMYRVESLEKRLDEQAYYKEHNLA
jgi:hypothetical protein